jgi:hypothetical protein
MRNFQTLETVTVDKQTGIIHFATQNASPMNPRLAMRREGDYVPTSVSYGPIEISLRLRHERMIWILTRLQPVAGLQTSRQVGTGQAYLAVGMTPEGELVARPTLEADATGRIVFNLLLTPECCKALFDWLEIEPLS